MVILDLDGFMNSVEQINMDNGTKMKVIKNSSLLGRLLNKAGYTAFKSRTVGQEQ